MKSRNKWLADSSKSTPTVTAAFREKSWKQWPAEWASAVKAHVVDDPRERADDPAATDLDDLRRNNHAQR